MNEDILEKWRALVEECKPVAEKHGVCPYNMAGSIAEEQGWWDAEICQKLEEN